MITTPPGLYLISGFINYCSKMLFGYQVSNVSELRALNSFLGLAILVVTKSIATELNASHPLERSLIVSLLPTLYIFNFLYYTDVGSVFFTLLSYYGLLKRRRLVYLLAGLVSLTFRQTNIIWVAGFFIGDIIYRKSKKVKLSSSNVRKLILSVICSALKFKVDLSIAMGLILAFSAFIWWNDGSIVLGDKQSHQVSIHWAQILYFFCFTAVFLLPAILNSYAAVFRNSSFLILASILASIATITGTIEHPYLLSDNRHWTNVIWRHVLNRRAFKLLRGRHILSPVYGIIVVLLDSSQPQDYIWKAGYILAAALSLIPSPLFEPRYYLIPIIIYVLHMKISSSQAIRTIIWLSLINVAVIGVFLYRPFIWNSEPSQLQRYIW